ncbi:DUF2786 domain-containing protein [Burkholderia multivorans]|uniref:DUF2786 domain-containing protein n=1 Tax=Burkholderia multivorans TaxID=87883 RepID=UPI000DAF4695|nr:DUF2786 domain-containing protein [Burkholderia multivorans]RAA31164.1 DUF2786 domain-containing protein [Burkholderia multivorans]RAA32558.1 DUF2786 domain-containing protein [Burkholderia multivorans]RAA37255.1 DUF2786 domain-containing protein [Burkholderia multivorans]RAA38192.1 DUF2786 domain-containing protein [Burkholderia multivorans]RAA41814.1 DUF2786 domain-containing protein [Burkholderia multivorans]
MDRSTAIAKIRKCLALSRSSEPHEAAAALRQAQKLMEQFGIDHPELLAAGACEEWSKSAAARRPVRYEVALAGVVADVYGCELLFRRQLNDACTAIVGGYMFVGVTPAPEIAKYTFDVFARQLRAARRDYIQVKLRRCGPKNKTARADEFCEGWVYSVRMQMHSATRTDEQTAMIQAYMRAHHAEVREFEPRTRDVAGRRTTDDHWHGVEQGRSAVVRPGVGAPDTRRLGHV